MADEAEAELGRLRLLAGYSEQVGVTGLALYSNESPALAAKAKKSNKRIERSSVPNKTGFEHQQCSIKNPCISRNMH